MSLFIDPRFVASNECNFDPSSTVEFTETDELIIFLKQWNKIYNNYEINFSQQSQMNCKKIGQSQINQCGCCQRIMIIFKYCQQVKEHNKIYTDTFGIFPKYTLTQFQNDMDHIIKHHGKDVNEGLFINEIGACDIKDCRVPAREARNGVKSPRTSPLTHSTHDGLQQIIRHLFIEEYHGYLFHPLDSKRNIEQLLTIYPDRNDRFVSTVISKIKKSNSKNKIEKTLLGSVAEDNDNDIEQKLDMDYKVGNTDHDTDYFMEEIEPLFFRFGHKFSYHRFTGSGDRVSLDPNYVGCKYEDLKKELIDDKTKNFTVEKWNILIARSTALSEKDESKNIKAKQTKYGWNTALGKCISIARIVAIALYTDYDGLTFKLCSTYRTDSDKKKQKQAHSRFAHWAKLLTSTVDIFGEEMRQGHSFYRGLSGPKYVFSLFSTDFNAPCSTTTRPGIAWSFAFSGIVVQIEKPEWKDGARFLNVVPFSAYKHEDEHLFVGPDNFLKIASIHQNLSTKTTSTEPLLLLQLLTHKMSHSIDMKKYIQNAPSNNILNDLYHNLKEMNNLENKENSNEYKYQLTNYFVNKKTKLYIKVKLIQDLVCSMKRKGKGNQKNECQNVLFWLVDGDIEEMYKKKEFQINFIGINELFRNITELTFDFKSSNLRLSHNENTTWNNVIQYMFTYWNNDANQTKNKSKVCKIVLQRLDALPSDEFINKIKNILKDSRWDVRAISNTITFFRGTIADIHRKLYPKKNQKHQKHEKHSKSNRKHQRPSDKPSSKNNKSQKDKPHVQRKRKECGCNVM